METLQANKADVQKAYSSADSKEKTLLESLFGKEILPVKITERIKRFEDACAITGDDPEDPKFTAGFADSNAFEKLKVIAKALNEGWYPNWENSSEYKYYPWFTMGSSGFRLDDVSYDRSHSTVGSRLCFKSEELARYAVAQFLDLYKAYMA
jgi:hypothetical protein